MAKESKFERPTKKSEYEIMFASVQARKGWMDLAATIRNPLSDAWDFLTRTLGQTTPTNYRLKGELGLVTRNGVTHDRWQHKPTLKGDARIWFYVEGKVVYLEQVHTPATQPDKVAAPSAKGLIRMNRVGVSHVKRNLSRFDVDIGSEPPFSLSEFVHLPGLWEYSHGMVAVAAVGTDVVFAESEPLYVALYLRDALQLESSGIHPFPPVDPPVRSASALAPSEKKLVSEQWLSWWNEILDYLDRTKSEVYVPPDYLGWLVERPALRRAVEPLLEQARMWHENQLDTTGDWKNPGSKNFLPFKALAIMKSGIPARKRRRLRNVQFLIMPVSEPVGWKLNPSQYLVSKALVHDPALFEAWFIRLLAAER